MLLRSEAQVDELLENHAKELERLTQALLEHESLNHNEIENLLSNVKMPAKVVHIREHHDPGSTPL